MINISTDKLNSLQEKHTFIQQVSAAFEMKPKGSTVEAVNFEVYVKDFGENRIHVVEYLVVHFVGGAISVRNVSGNSNIANFRELAKLVGGGYYDEVRDYTEIANEYEAINLN